MKKQEYRSKIRSREEEEEEEEEEKSMNASLRIAAR